MEGVGARLPVRWVRGMFLWQPFCSIFAVRTYFGVVGWLPPDASSNSRIFPRSYGASMVSRVALLINP